MRAEYPQGNMSKRVQDVTAMIIIKIIRKEMRYCESMSSNPESKSIVGGTNNTPTAIMRKSFETCVK